MKSKLDNATENVREVMKIGLQLIEKLHIKSKTVMNWSSRERKRVFLL